MKTLKLQAYACTPLFKTGVKFFLSMAILLCTVQLSYSQVSLTTEKQQNEVVAPTSVETTPVPPIIFKQLGRLGDSPTHIDVYGQIVRCSGSSVNQIFMKVKNEINVEQTAVFTVTVTNNDTGDSFTEDFNIPLAMFEVVQANCENGSIVKIDLPGTYNPHNTTVVASF